MNIPQPQHADIIRAYYQNHYVDQLFPIISSKFNTKNIDTYLSIHGLADLDRALQKGRGVILVHGHFGPVHLPLVALALKGYLMKQIGNPSDKGLSWVGRNVSFRLRMVYEGRMQAEIIRADSFLRPVFKALQQNTVIMTTGDGSGSKEQFGRQYQFTFLGQPVLLSLGPAILARKTGAPLLPLFIVPGEEKPFSLIIKQEIRSSLPGTEGIIESMSMFATLLEQHIRLFPGYMHFLDRFCPGQFILRQQTEAT